MRGRKKKKEKGIKKEKRTKIRKRRQEYRKRNTRKNTGLLLNVTRRYRKVWLRTR